MADTAVAERTLPHNLEAERSVLGAILLHNDAFNLAAEVIDSGDFFRDAHRRIFDKMVTLVERGHAVDLVTLKEELGRSGQLEEVGGPAYIAALVDGVPRSMNVAQHVGTKTDMTVGLFSLEMSKEQLFLRMLTAEARIDAHRLRGGFLGERDWGKLSQAIGALSETKIFIDDTPSIGVLEMRAKCRRLASEHGLHLVIVDYIQLMQGRGRFENRTLELASISRSMKGLAKELNVPIVVLSQLSRAPESRSDHRPQLSDLRESGALEQDADVVAFIYRDDVYQDKSQPASDSQGVAELIIGKQRNGPTGVVKLAFIREYTRFENLAIGAS